MENKLLPYQLDHVEILYTAIHKHARALDASDTGTGKTYTSIALCQKLKLKPFIICPKSVVASWINILSNFEYKKNEYEITTYEQLPNHKFLKKIKEKENKSNIKNIINIDNNKNNLILTKKVIKIETNDIEPNDIEPNDIETSNNESCENENSDKEINFKENILTKTKYSFLFEEKKILKKDEEYNWNFNNINPKQYLFIYDEAHKCKNRNTINGKILINLSEKNTNIILLSATAVDKPLNFLIFGFVLKLYNTFEDGLYFLSNTCNKKARHPLIGVHKIIFPEYASRMCIDEIKNIFKENYIVMDGIKMDNFYEIEKQYEIINQNIKNKNKNSLSNIQKIRQQIEILKVDTFVEMTNNYIEDGKSVVIFVNFTDTLILLSKKLKTKCIVYGQQTINERSNNINKFCNDLSRIIICNIQSGGCGISLHDTNGKYPRISLISPTWSAQDLMQVLGRIHRATGKSDVIQRIVFCKDTFEENIGKILKEKINNIRMLNDGDKVMKKDNMKNIIEKEFNIQVKKKEKDNRIYESNDFDKIQELLSQLYEKRDFYYKEMETLKLINSKDKKIKEYEYYYNKFSNEILMNEENLQSCINKILE